MFIFHSSSPPNPDFSETSPSDSKSVTSIYRKAAAVLSSTSHLLTISDTKVS